jgi:hypothetical protein
MRSAYSKYTVLLLLGLLSFIASSCVEPMTVSAAASSSGMFLSSSSAIQVSPTSADPATLNVKVAVNEDQAASDGRSAITVQFSTIAIHNQNYVQFTNEEKIVCNGVSLIFRDSVYSDRVEAVNGRYTCTYQWAGGTSMIISVIARTRLSPRLVPDAAGHNFIVRYNPDPVHRCDVKVEASDGSQTISGPSVLESGDVVYTGPDRSALSGSGMLVMTRLCTFTFVGPDTDFNIVNATYTSTAKSDVTWFTPNA